jgi:hypothetical protein
MEDKTNEQIIEMLAYQLSRMDELDYISLKDWQVAEEFVLRFYKEMGDFDAGE